MPNIDSAKKRMRQGSKRRIQNRSRKAMIRTFTRKLDEAIEEGNTSDAAEHYRTLQKKLDKAAKGSTIHPNKAARKKSRLQKRLNALKAGNKDS